MEPHLERRVDLHAVAQSSIDVFARALHSEMRRLESERDRLEAERHCFLEERQKFYKESRWMERSNRHTKDAVKLNVGGVVFTTTLGTLHKEPDSMLSAMFSGRHRIECDGEGNYKVDRDPELFRVILNMLRNDEDPELREKICRNPMLREQLSAEARYFCLGRLSKFLQDAEIFEWCGARTGSVHPEPLLTLTHHSGMILSSIIMDDVLYVGSADTTISVISLVTYTVMRLLEGHTDYVTCLLWHGPFLVSGSRDTRILFWRGGERLEGRPFVGHTGFVQCLASFNDEFIISGGQEKVLKVWRTGDRECVQTLEIPDVEEGGIKCCVMYGDTLFAGCGNKILSIRLSHDGTMCTHLRVLEGTSGNIRCLAVSEEFNLLLSGAWDGSIMLWDLTVPTNLKHQGEKIRISADWVSSLMCVAGVVVASANTNLSFWNLRTKAMEAMWELPHADYVRCFLFHRNVAITGSFDKTIRFWKK